MTKKITIGIFNLKLTGESIPQATKTYHKDILRLLHNGITNGFVVMKDGWKTFNIKWETI